jgi:hypothetical protein
MTKRQSLAVGFGLAVFFAFAILPLITEGVEYTQQVAAFEERCADWGGSAVVATDLVACIKAPVAVLRNGQWQEMGAQVQ